MIENLFKTLPPKNAVNYLQQLLEEFKNPAEFKQRYQQEIERHVKVEGRGFPPVAVTLGGLMSIAGVIVAYTVCNNLKYLITSPEVEAGQGFFTLSHQYYEALLGAGLEPVIIPFNAIPKYGDAERLLAVLEDGAVVLNGVSAELAAWFGRNAGVGRLIIYRPESGVGVFRYV